MLIDILFANFLFLTFCLRFACFASARRCRFRHVWFLKFSFYLKLRLIITNFSGCCRPGRESSVNLNLLELLLFLWLWAFLGLISILISANSRRCNIWPLLIIFLSICELYFANLIRCWYFEKLLRIERSLILLILFRWQSYRLNILLSSLRIVLVWKIC